MYTQTNYDENRDQIKIFVWRNRIKNIFKLKSRSKYKFIFINL